MPKENKPKARVQKLVCSAVFKAPGDSLTRVRGICSRFCLIVSKLLMAELFLWSCCIVWMLKIVYESRAEACRVVESFK